ncbi:bifunctional DNA primase/polymerase [Cohaesibacter intestini]|uniref:bifunctional DNA primase/polymerase n=1 Tax=Cohaesibacter intestini TaxID=2211145 RepID=UPI0013005980|nr:bifunctional DNA primase/polymerase [Cohaesibacter intestini]
MNAALQKEIPGAATPGTCELLKSRSEIIHPDPSQFSPMTQEKALRDELIFWALAYAKRGYPIYPINIDGTPLVDWNGVTTPESKVREWWGKFPFAMIGMSVGLWSGIWCLKVKDRNTLESLKRSGWAIPEKVVEIVTPLDELMFLFRPEQNFDQIRGSIAPGVHVFGTGDFVLLPPSRPALGGPDYFLEEGQELEVGQLV